MDDAPVVGRFLISVPLMSSDELMIFLMKKAEELQKSKIKYAAIDLSALSVLMSTEIGQIAAVIKHTRQMGGDTLIYAPKGTVKDILYSVRFNSIARFVFDVDDFHNECQSVPHLAEGVEENKIADSKKKTRVTPVIKPASSEPAQQTQRKSPTTIIKKKRTFLSLIIEKKPVQIILLILSFLGIIGLTVLTPILFLQMNSQDQVRRQFREYHNKMTKKVDSLEAELNRAKTILRNR